MAFIKGMDLSTLEEVEARGGRFSDRNGPGDPMAILRRHGMDLVRLRLWNDPYSPQGEPYGAGTCDLNTVMALARRARTAGCQWMLDFHYSDFWADPGKQITPKAWQGMDIKALEEQVYSFTGDALRRLREEGLAPDMVAVGNEVTNGLLWPVGRMPAMGNIARLLSAGLRACREVCPEAETVIHLDNGPDSDRYRAWFEGYFAAGGMDFDIIGMSYYPFWNGPMEGLARSMAATAARFGKDVLVAETSMGFTLEDYGDYERLAPDQRKGMAATAALAERQGLHLVGTGVDTGAGEPVGHPGGPGLHRGEGPWGKRVGQPGAFRLQRPGASRAGGDGDNVRRPLCERFGLGKTNAHGEISMRDFLW